MRSWQLPAPAVLVAAWGGNHFSPLLLMYRQVDGYSAVQVDAFFAFYVLGLTPGFLLAGPLSDQYGRKKLVTAALGLGVIGSVVLASGDAAVAWMYVGRLICGLSVAIAMVAGTSWIKELSQRDADPSTRARRASLTLTAGFGLGAGVSGVLAQWGPWPTITPYLLQIGLSVVALPLLLRARETRGAGRPHRSIVADLKPPARSRRRFLLVVLPMAPWVFAAPALAFVVAPALAADRLGGVRIGFAGLAAVVTLCFGAAAQPLVPAIGRRTGGRQGVVGLAAVALAAAVLAAGAAALSPLLALLDTALFGAGYGICIVAGLVEVQAMADPEALAGLTGIYYSLTYLGFALPVLLSGLAHEVAYGGLLVGVTAVCIACAAVVAVGVRTGHPADARVAGA